MNSAPKKSLLEVAIAFFLCKVNELIQNFQGFWLFLCIQHCFNKATKITTPPVEIEVISLFKQVWDFLQDLHKLLGPSRPHTPSDNMPSLHRSIVNYKLVLGFVLRPGCNINSALYEWKGKADLGEVCVALELLLSNFSFFDTGFCQECTAKELIFLCYSLEEDVCDSTCLFIPCVGEKRHFNIHHDNLWTQLSNALPWIIKYHLFSIFHAIVCFNYESLVLLCILGVESAIL